MGLVGLNPDLVERWRMSWSHQRSWGRRYVGLIKDLHTPILRSCFLTGLNVEKHGYTLSELKENRDGDAFRGRLLYRLYLVYLSRRIPSRSSGLGSC